MRCPCCGSERFGAQKVLGQELIDEWRLASHEVAYIDRQQGVNCLECGSNLRSMILAQAITTCFQYPGLFRDFVKTDGARLLRVLEVNEAASLTVWLKELPGHRLVRYPEVDMTRLPFEDRQYDLVVHSDTLEHVERPIRGLSECRRVLKPGGFCAFTVPIVVDRLTRSREGLPPAYHGASASPRDYLVHTEYGADAWKHVIQAGFRECRIFALDYPSALALVGVR
jgi:SAM-dependent methyltransferase